MYLGRYVVLGIPSTGSRVMAVIFRPDVELRRSNNGASAAAALSGGRSAGPRCSSSRRRQLADRHLTKKQATRINVQRVVGQLRGCLRILSWHNKSIGAARKGFICCLFDY